MQTTKTLTHPLLFLSRSRGPGLIETAAGEFCETNARAAFAFASQPDAEEFRAATERYRDWQFLTITHVDELSKQLSLYNAQGVGLLAINPTPSLERPIWRLLDLKQVMDWATGEQDLLEYTEEQRKG